MLLVGGLVELLELRDLVLRVDETVRTSEMPSYDVVPCASRRAAIGNHDSHAIDRQLSGMRVFTYAILIDSIASFAGDIGGLRRRGLARSIDFEDGRFNQEHGMMSLDWWAEMPD